MNTPRFAIHYEKYGHDVIVRAFASHDGSEPQFVSRFTLPAWAFFLLVQALQIGCVCMTPRIEIGFVKVEGAAEAGETTARCIGVNAYMVADAMLAERENGAGHG